MIITIDGPVATGKSTIAKRLAEKIGFIYFDTGAMYRCLTYVIIKNQIDLDDLKQLKRILKDFSFEIKVKNREKHYIVLDEDVTDKIRGEAVTALVSKVSAIKEVREKLLVLQKQWAEGADAVFEGRDIGTVVFPDAEVKIFLTGRTDVRAQRRFAELKAKFPNQELTFEQTVEELKRRDHYDTHRDIAPLRQADDALVIDTSDLTVDQVLNKIMEYKKQKTHQ